MTPPTAKVPANPAGGPPGPASPRPAIPELQSRERWERGFARLVTAAGIGSIVLLLLLPSTLGGFMGPIIHMSDVELVYDSGCTLDLLFILSNSGNRAGNAWVSFFVNEAPYATWKFFVPAHHPSLESETFTIQGCDVDRFGVAIVSIAAA